MNAGRVILVAERTLISFIMICCSMSSVRPTNHPSSGLSSKRPRLRLQTSTLDQSCLLGRTTTALQPGETESPTVQNTYNNAHHPSSTVPSHLSLGGSSPPDALKTASPLPIRRRMNPSSGCSYQQPPSIGSMAQNRSSPRTYSVMRPGRRRFPSPKRVRYKSPVYEEIKTTKFILAHIDLFRKDAREDDDVDVEDSEDSQSPRTGIASAATRPRSLLIPCPQDSDTTSSAGCQTPGLQGRRQRRDWKWTLGPIQSTGASVVDPRSSNDPS